MPTLLQNIVKGQRKWYGRCQCSVRELV